MILNWQKNKHSEASEMRGTVWKFWVPAVAAFLLAMVFNIFFFRLVRIQGASMEPTLCHNDWVISSPRVFQNADPERGDVVLIRRRSLTQGYIVKRVIALPGEQVEIREGIVYVNGEIIEDPFSKANKQENMLPIIVAQDSFFVLGDNREVSRDSREWDEPMIHKEELFGKVILTVFPRIERIN